jgi:hypothetical protein
MAKAVSEARNAWISIVLFLVLLTALSSIAYYAVYYWRKAAKEKI